MENKLNNRKLKFIIAAFLIVLTLLIVIAGSFQDKISPQTTTNEEIPTPTSVEINTAQVVPSNVPARSEKYKKSIEEIYKKQDVVVAKEAAIGKLLDAVPYKGQYIKITHDFDHPRFIVTIAKGKEKEGSDEFDNFLKQHEIENRSWFRPSLLLIQYE